MIGPDLPAHIILFSGATTGMRGPRPFRIFLMGILALTPLAQSFWLIRAWHAMDALSGPGARVLSQSLWGVAVLAAVLDLVVGPSLFRRSIGPWGRAIARLWLIASCVGYLAV